MREDESKAKLQEHIRVWEKIAALSGEIKVSMIKLINIAKKEMKR